MENIKMKLNVSLSPLCLALALFSGTAYADGVIVAGTMHKTGSLAVGKESVSGENAAAVGDKAKAGGYKAAALGYDSAASGLSATALGGESKAEALRSVAVGFRAHAKGTNDVAVGGAAAASGGQSVAVGLLSKASALRAVAVGNGAQASNIDAVAIGRDSEADALSATALGDRAKARGTQSLALASAAEAEGYQAVAVGTRAVSNAVNSVALGVESSATALNGLAVGTSSSVRKEGGTAVGGGASALEEKSLALGFQAKGKAEKAVALGAQSIADLAAGQAGYDFATQSESQSEDKTWKSTLGAVSVGNEKDSRQITHVAAGTQDTDAVNVAQVKRLAERWQADSQQKESAVAAQINQIRVETRVEMKKLEDRADAGSAAASAVGNLGQAYQPGQGAVSIGSGVWRGKAGFAVGVSKVSASGKWLVKGSAVGASKGGAGGGASVTYLW